MADNKCPLCGGTLTDGARTHHCGYNVEMSAAHVEELKKARAPKVADKPTDPAK